MRYYADGHVADSRDIRKCIVTTMTSDLTESNNVYKEGADAPSFFAKRLRGGGRFAIMEKIQRERKLLHGISQEFHPWNHRV